MDDMVRANLIVRGDLINFGKSTFNEISSIYRFTNENMSSYFHHLKNKNNVLSVVGSGCQIANSLLAGSRNIDTFDISIFPIYFMHLKLASILALNKEDFLKFYFSEDRDVVFSDEMYDKISLYLNGKYKEFWDYLFMYDDGYDIYNSLLFRSDLVLEKMAILYNPYLQDDNYQRLRNILKYDSFNISSSVCDITKMKIDKKYDLINLSNILSYYYKADDIEGYVNFLKNNFCLNKNGEIINYFYRMDGEVEESFQDILIPSGYVETLKDDVKLLVLGR